MDNRTDTLAAAKLSVVLIALLFANCARRSPSAEYEKIWAIYLRGDLREAAEKAAEMADRRRSEPNPLWYWKLRLLEAEALNSVAKVDDADKLLAGPVPDRPDLSQIEVRRLIDLANLPKHLEDAPELLRRIRQTVTDPELTIRMYLTEGVLGGCHDPTGEAATHTALDMALRESKPYWQFWALNNLSYCAKQNNLLEKSVELATRALGAAEKAGARNASASAHGNLGSAYALLGDFESAFEHHKEAVRIFELSGARARLATALGEFGLAFDLEDNPHEAIPIYTKAYQIAIELKTRNDARRFAENLSTAFVKSDQWDEADDWNRRATELAEATKSRDAIPYLERNRARIEYGRGHYEEAAKICNELLRTNAESPGIRWAVYALLGAVESEQHRYRNAAKEFENALEVINSNRSNLLNQRYRVTLLSRLIPFYQAYADMLAQRGDDMGALRVIESGRARVMAERLGRVSATEPLPDLAVLKEFARSAKCSLLSFQIARHSFAWLITANGMQRFDLPSSIEIEKLVTDYRAVVEHSLRDPVVSNSPSGTALWNGVMARIAAQIQKDSRVIVIPDGPLHRLNLETLVVPTPQPHYWIEDVELAVAPSITIAISKPDLRARNAGGLLLLGAPDYAGTPYQPLKGAEREIQDIQRRFPAARIATLMHSSATPAAYRGADPGSFSIIHLAAHAEANPEKPLDSAVIFSRQGDQYKLYVRDVIDTPINADLVTLSACHSAGSRAYAGEGLMGFAWAFLQSGAHTVVAGLWSANDESTELLMDKFYAGIAAGESTVTALRQAKRALLTGDPRYHKPFFWGPFQTYIGSVSSISRIQAKLLTGSP